MSQTRYLTQSKYTQKDWPINIVLHEYPHIVEIGESGEYVDLHEWKAMKQWCAQHCTEWMEFLFNSGPSVFMFKYEGDAVLFSLRWS